MKENNLILQLAKIFLKIGAFTFGGGYAMIALLEKECVEKKQWISHEEFMNILVIAESTPGPIAINCATYTGYKIKGFIGAIVATLSMITPSIITLYIISMFFENLLEYELVTNVFKGIRIAVAILILQAGLGMAKKVLKKANEKNLAIAFFSIFFLATLISNVVGSPISTIWLIIIAGISGFVLYSKNPKAGEGK